MKRILVIALLAMAALAATSSVYAAIPSANGTISACKDQKGSLKVIDAETGQVCNGSQQLLTWNQQGPAGQPGQDGVSGYETVDTVSATNSNGDKYVSVFCPSGKKALGGGAGVYGPLVAGGQLIVDGVAIVQSNPFNDDGWGARAAEFVPTEDTWYLSVWAICADIS
jgi:hypothetical protein